MGKGMEEDEVAEFKEFVHHRWVFEVSWINMEGNSVVVGWKGGYFDGGESFWKRNLCSKKLNMMWYYIYL